MTKIYIVKYEKENNIGVTFIDSVWDNANKAVERCKNASLKYTWNIYWVEDWNVNEEEDV